MEFNGGVLVLQSEVGRGITVRVSFPPERVVLGLRST